MFSGLISVYCAPPGFVLKKYTLNFKLNRMIIMLHASCIDFKIATLTDKAVHVKQPLFLAQHLKLKYMHLNILITGMRNIRFLAEFRYFESHFGHF